MLASDLQIFLIIFPPVHHYYPYEVYKDSVEEAMLYAQMCRQPESSLADQASIIMPIILVFVGIVAISFIYKTIKESS